MDMRSQEMIERRRDDNGVGNISSIITNEDNGNGNNNNNNNTRVSSNSQTLVPNQSNSPSSFSISTVRYRECLKNHAATVGGSVYDGCGEFMPSGEEGTLEALRCAACDCHRNFHRKENDDGVGSSDIFSHHRHHQHHHRYGGGGGGRNMMLNPLMLPPPPMHHHRYGMSSPGGGGMVTPMSVAYGGGGGAESSSEDLNMYGQSSGEHGGGVTPGQTEFSMMKRFRTKFTAEQKEKMTEFAEKLGWRMNKQDEEELKRFCGEIGVKRQVFKVWMHNNKNNAKKPPVTTT